ncbi:hypothetical protein [Lacticaseibacillus sp. N501-2]|uniref:hypothetical protein n=1 Tax=Lacticaseibacillus salsurae TaxID=3367729 RepID=UPI0038B3CE25
MRYQCSDVVEPVSLSQAVAHFQSHLKPGHVGQIQSLDDPTIPAVLITYAVAPDGSVSLEDALTDACPDEDAQTWQRILAPYHD